MKRDHFIIETSFSAIRSRREKKPEIVMERVLQELSSAGYYAKPLLPACLVCSPSVRARLDWFQDRAMSTQRNHSENQKRAPNAKRLHQLKCFPLVSCQLGFVFFLTGLPIESIKHLARNSNAYFPLRSTGFSNQSDPNLCLKTELGRKLRFLNRRGEFTSEILARTQWLTSRQ